MGRIAFINGRYLPHAEASVHVEDRGFQFADGVYEVIAVRNRRLIDLDLHLERLDHSLREIALPWPVSQSALMVVLAEMVRRNRIAGFGVVYLQVTRGVSRRNHAFPTGVRPTLVMTARALPEPTLAAARQGVAVILQPDLRWRRCDIKSVGLLPNVLSRQRAVAAGAYEAWLVDSQGRVTEGAASNAWIVTSAGHLVTHAAEPGILNGITRRVVLDLAQRLGIPVEERPFAVTEARAAAEAFLTSTSSLIKPVIRIDDQMISEGRIGALTERLQAAYFRHVEAQEP